MPSVVPLRAALAWISFACASASAWLASANCFTSVAVSFSVRSGVEAAAGVGSCGCMSASRRMAVIITLSLNSNFYPNRVGDAIGMFAHLLLGFGFNHYPGEGFGTGIAHHHSPIAVQIDLRLLNALNHPGNLVEGPLFANPPIDNPLGEDGKMF